MVVVAARRTLIRKRGVSSCPPDYSMEAHGRFRHNNTLNVNQGESFRRTHQVADDHSISGDFEALGVTQYLLPSLAPSSPYRLSGLIDK